MLGFDHFSAYYNRRPDVVEWYREGKIAKVIWWASKFDSFDDGPWYNLDLISKLDKAFPGSKFVLLNREEKAYVTSYLNYFKKLPHVKTLKDPDKIIEEYLNHRNACISYFSGRDEDFIDLSVAQEDGFERLALFLGNPVIQRKFPHMNRTK